MCFNLGGSIITGSTINHKENTIKILSRVGNECEIKKLYFGGIWELLIYCLRLAQVPTGNKDRIKNTLKYLKFKFVKS